VFREEKKGAQVGTGGGEVRKCGAENHQSGKLRGGFNNNPEKKHRAAGKILSEKSGRKGEADGDLLNFRCMHRREGGKLRAHRSWGVGPQTVRP